MSVFIITAIAGVVELCRRLEKKEYYAALTIVLAAVIGGLAGYFEVDNVKSVEAGIVAGLAASGIVTVAQKVSTKR